MSKFLPEKIENICIYEIFVVHLPQILKYDEDPIHMPWQYLPFTDG